MSDSFKAKPTKRKDWRTKKAKEAKLRNQLLQDNFFKETDGFNRKTLPTESADIVETVDIPSRD